MRQGDVGMRLRDEALRNGRWDRDFGSSMAEDIIRPTIALGFARIFTMRAYTQGYWE